MILFVLHFVLSTSTDVVCERISAAFSAFSKISFRSHMPTFLPYSPAEALNLSKRPCLSVPHSSLNRRNPVVSPVVSIIAFA